MAKKDVKPGEVTKARVLMTGEFGQIDSVVEVDAQLAEDHPDLDPTPEAVAYAESLRA